jgi:hypothetical protein
MEAGWFLEEVRAQTQHCDFLPLVTTATDGDDGGWFRNTTQAANLWGGFYGELIERLRAGQAGGIRPALISDYIDRRGAHGWVTLDSGARNTGEQDGSGLAQWTASQAERDALSRVAQLSEAVRATGTRSAVTHRPMSWWSRPDGGPALRDQLQLPLGRGVGGALSSRPRRSYHQTRPRCAGRLNPLTEGRGADARRVRRPDLCPYRPLIRDRLASSGTQPTQRSGSSASVDPKGGTLDRYSEHAFERRRHRRRRPFAAPGGGTGRHHGHARPAGRASCRHLHRHGGPRVHVRARGGSHLRRLRGTLVRPTMCRGGMGWRELRPFPRVPAAVDGGRVGRIGGLGPPR